MSITLLKTKLYIPPVRDGLVPRPHLIEKLYAGLRLDQRLTLVSAPAGFGKTTLVSDWVVKSKGPVGWITLDESDNDPLRFLTYLVSSMQVVDESIGQGVIEAVQSAQPPPVESILLALVNQIAARSEPFILVMDDYQLVEDISVHNIISYLIEHMPPIMHIVIVTRGDPPIPVAKLRGRGQLNEIRLEDLRFTLDEVTEFLNKSMGLDLSHDEVSTLTYRTEGWIAGLQMTALALKAKTAANGDEPARLFIQSLAESDRYILDYLVEEVLQRQPVVLQNFLLYTSILKRMCGPLCDAVVGNGVGGADLDPVLTNSADPLSFQSSQEILEYLDQSNLFVIPLDGKQEWYRYHRLFADALRVRLLRSHPDLSAVLHGFASDWYEESGYPSAAIDHALSAEDFKKAAKLVDGIAVSILSRGELTTLLKWLDTIPDDVKSGRPILFLYHAWVLFINDCPIDLVEARVEEAVRFDKEGRISPEITMFRATLASEKGDIQGSIALSQEALGLLPADSFFFRGVAVRSLAAAYELAGDLSAAISAYDDAVRMDQKAGNDVGSIMGLTKLARLRIIQGRLHDARALYKRALAAGTDGRGGMLPVAGRALIGLGVLHHEWNDLGAAKTHLDEGITLVRRWSNAWAIEGYISLALVNQAIGDLDEARQAIVKADELAVAFDASDMDDLEVSLTELRLRFLQGNIEAVARWFDEHGLVEEINAIPVSYSLQEIEKMLLARVCTAQGQYSRALTMLESIQGGAELYGRTGVLIECLVLQALSYLSQGESQSAVEVIEQALSIAEPEGYVRVFLDEGQPMAQLLYMAANQRIMPEYSRKLLNEFEPVLLNSGTKFSLDQRAGGTVEVTIQPLSEREQEVLRLIADGLSNQEIAQQLYISLRTVKWHSGNIYQKLAVKNRTQAVNKARQLGIIPI